MRQSFVLALLLLLGCGMAAASDLGRRALLASTCPELVEEELSAYNIRKRTFFSLACFSCEGTRMLHCSERTDGLCIFKNGVSCFYKARACKPSDEEVLGLFAEWNAALATGNADEVAAMYAEDAILLPTVSNQVRNSPALILDYFEKFLLNQPQGVINSHNIRHLADGVVQNTGIYTFYLSGNRRVQARYSYTYERMPNGKWLIMEHHSSVLPEQPAANATFTPTAVDLAEVRAAFDTWNAALNKTAEDVVACYAPDAVLLPTVSNIVRNTPAKILNYFQTFILKKPFGTITYEEGSSPNIRFLEPTVAINSGVYIFRLTENGVTTNVPARYTFVYQKVNGKWLIKEHHSSQMPEPVATTAPGAGRR